MKKKINLCCLILCAIMFVSCTKEKDIMKNQNGNEIAEDTPTEPVDTTTEGKHIDDSPKTSGTDLKTVYTKLSGTEKQLLKELPVLLGKKIQIHDNDTYVALNGKNRVIALERGDLSGDGIDELAIILEFHDETKEKSEYRCIYILQGNADDKYTIVNKNENLILGAAEGGPFGEPLEGIGIRNKVLSIKHYGGSSSRWGYDMHFSYQDKQLILTDMTESGRETYTPDVQSDDGETGDSMGVFDNAATYDFIHATAQVIAWKDNQDEYVLYDGEMPSKQYFFDKVVFKEMSEYHLLPYLPYIDVSDFSTFVKEELKLSASDALDQIMKKYYPHFKKINIPWTNSNRLNYSTLLGFLIPNYYYEGTEGILAYKHMNRFDNMHRIELHLTESDGNDPTSSVRTYNVKAK